MNSHARLRLVPPPSPPLVSATANTRWIGVVEGAVLIGIIFAIERFGLIDFAILPFHPMVLAVAILAAQYGALGGIVAASAATVVALVGGALPQRVIGEGYFDYLTAVWSTPLAWLVIAVLVGMVADRNRKALTAAESNIEMLGQERDLIASQYEILEARAKRLERLAAGFDSHKRLMS